MALSRGPWLGTLSWLVLAWLLTGTSAQVQAQTPAEPPPALDLRETVVRLPVTVQDGYGRSETKAIAVTHFRPAGDGPFPLVVMNHGRASTDKRAHQARFRYEPLARYLVGKGFAVFVPTRVGYGDTFGDFDPETNGGCNTMRLAPVAQAASDQVLAVVAHAATLTWVDASHWLVMGASVGGFTTLAVAARQPAGLQGAINFSGGHGGNPETRPGDPCGPRVLARLWQQQAATARVPTLWLYWQNDRYWGPDWPLRWAQAWRDGGGLVEMHLLAAAGDDGHGGLGIDMDHWVPLAEGWLAQLGYTRSGVVERPAPSGFAAVGDASRVPIPERAREQIYARFLAAKPPRAFAVGPGGAAGFAFGDWALGRALGFCQARRGQACKLYAVDDDVVWVP